MDINFGLVDTFSPEIVVHLFHWNSLVIDRGVLVNEVPVRLSGYCFEQC